MTDVLYTIINIKKSSVKIHTAFYYLEISDGDLIQALIFFR